MHPPVVPGTRPPVPVKRRMHLTVHRYRALEWPGTRRDERRYRDPPPSVGVAGAGGHEAAAIAYERRPAAPAVPRINAPPAASGLLLQLPDAPVPHPGFCGTSG